MTVRTEPVSRAAREAGGMELGVYGLNAKATLEPAVTARLARRAEELGYRSWWVGEHVVRPTRRCSQRIRCWTR